MCKHDANHSLHSQLLAVNGAREGGMSGEENVGSLGLENLLLVWRDWHGQGIVYYWMNGCPHYKYLDWEHTCSVWSGAAPAEPQT